VPERQKSFQETELERKLEPFVAEMTEFAEIISENLPEELQNQFNDSYVNVKFIPIMGEDRVCSRCGALVHAGSRRHHAIWHRQLTFAIWSLQGFTLATVQRVEDVLNEELPKLVTAIEEGLENM
jgi:hypothetical protein